MEQVTIYHDRCVQFWSGQDLGWKNNCQYGTDEAVLPEKLCLVWKFNDLKNNVKQSCIVVGRHHGHRIPSE